MYFLLARYINKRESTLIDEENNLNGYHWSSLMIVHSMITKDKSGLIDLWMKIIVRELWSVKVCVLISKHKNIYGLPFKLSHMKAPNRYLVGNGNLITRKRIYLEYISVLTRKIQESLQREWPMHSSNESLQTPLSGIFILLKL